MSMDLLIEKIVQMKNPTVAGLDPKLDYVPEFIKKKAFEEKVAAAVGFHAAKGISVAQVVSEVFTVAYIHEAR